MSRLVNIAFQGGTHGNYLRYCIDRFSRKTPSLTGSPFSLNHTSHNKLQKSNLVIEYHPNLDTPHFKNTNEPHILITIDDDDVLFLERWVTIRAGDHRIDTDKDSVKLNEQFGKCFVWADKLMKYYKIDVTKQSVPRYILRDFYKLSFLDHKNNGFIKNDRLFRSEMPHNTFEFPVNKFWDKQSFVDTIRDCGDKLDLDLDLSDVSVHDEFLKGLHKLDTRDRASKIITALQNNINTPMSGLDTVEQAYVSAWIEKNYDFVTMPLTNNFFSSTGELLEWLEFYPEHYKAMNPNLPTFNGIANPYHLAKLKK